MLGSTTKPHSCHMLNLYLLQLTDRRPAVAARGTAGDLVLAVSASEISSRTHMYTRFDEKSKMKKGFRWRLDV